MSQSETTKPSFMNWLWELTGIFQLHQDLPPEMSLDPATYNPLYMQGLTPEEAYLHEGNKLLSKEEVDKKLKKKQEEKDKAAKENRPTEKKKRSLLKMLFG